MQKSSKFSGIALATAAAMLFAAAPVATVSAADAKIKCEGGNSCKGKSACNGASNSCAGQNSCAGKGWVMLTKAECDAAKAKNKAKS